jgi:DNA-binding MarR family transcriptional regulator
MFLTVEQRILMALLEQEPLQNNQIARRIGITQEHCCRVVHSMIQEGLLLSEFHASRRVNRLSPIGRQITERISEAKNISANLIRK